jgi:hypothetical protein
LFFNKRTNSYKLNEKVATFSLSNAQLDVGYLSNHDGNKVKGLDLVFPSQQLAPYGPRGTHSYILKDSDAADLHAFLSQVLSNDLPADHDFRNDVSGRWFSSGDCCWKITKFLEEWHGGGGYKGWIDNSYGYVITKKSTLDLRECVGDFFDISV